MKRIWPLCVALIWSQIALAVPEAPFQPLTNIPDYVATFFVRLYHGPTLEEVRVHHGGWTRVDEGFDRDSWRTRSYFGPGELFISFAYEPSARIEGFDWLHVMRGPAMAHLIRWGVSPFKIGESQTFLGESCDVWNLNLSKGLLRPDARRLSCVTSDGIELWSRVDDTLPGTSHAATGFVRRQVEPDEVRPPSDKLNLKSWLTSPNDVTTPSDAPGDITVVMQDALRHLTRTMRRHYPWIYTEYVDEKGARSLTFENKVERLSIHFRSGADGEPMQLDVEKALKDIVRPKPPDNGRTETVLGESCVVSERRSFEEYSNQCRTADDVLLKDAGGSLFGRYDLVAVKLDRGQVNLDAVLPPASIFAPGIWRIPE